MGKRISKFVTGSMWVVIILFVIRCMISKPTSIYNFIGCTEEVIAISVIIMSLYERWLWRYNPFEKTPKLCKEYYGKIEYCYEGKNGQKDIVIKINQSLLYISINIITDEISSKSVFSKLVFENNEYVLYYTYITNPKSKYSEKNPIQYGTCRMILDEKNNFQGIYWTSRKTIGDIYFIRNDKNVIENKSNLNVHI